MIQVFCNKRGSGKTKKLISLANEQVSTSKGDSVYIDNSSKYIRQINSKIRFVSTKEFNVKSHQSFYGLLCGILSENYDIENIYIDNVLDEVINSSSECESWFVRIFELAKNFKLNMYININYEEREIPNFIKEYVA